MQVEHGIKHSEADPWHKFSKMFTVVIDYPRNYQIRVFKLIRGSIILNIRFLKLRQCYHYIRTNTNTAYDSDIRFLANVSCHKVSNFFLLVSFLNLCTHNIFIMGRLSIFFNEDGLYKYREFDPIKFLWLLTETRFKAMFQSTERLQMISFRFPIWKLNFRDIIKLYVKGTILWIYF